MSTLADYYTNPNYWQEYECGGCKTIFSVSPIPKPDTMVECSCFRSYPAGYNSPTTYIPEPGQPPRIVAWPQPED